METFKSLYTNAATNTARRRDPILIASIIILLGLGLVTLCSASFAFFESQVKVCIAGIVLFVIASLIDINKLRKWVIPLCILALVLCILTFVRGIGLELGGAKRWIKIGRFTYQPSELVKLVLPLYLAHIFDKKRDSLDVFFKSVLPPFVVSVTFILLIISQSFSTGIFITLNVLVIFFLAGIRLRYFISAFFIFVPMSVLLLLLKPHRVDRIQSFLRPGSDPLGIDYQSINSVKAVSSGGFLGKGIGQGTLKSNGSVPEIHSDFIFTAYCEEGGFLGVALFLILLAVFAVLGYKGALGCDTLFKRLLGVSLVTIIVSQALMNITVASGLLPVTGVPLPFFSHGGSSLITTLVSAGLIVNISRHKTRGVQEALYG